MSKYKEKMGDILNKIKGNKRIMWLSIISVLVLFTAALNITFAKYTHETTRLGANIIIGKLKYNMQVNNGELEDRILRISKNDTDVFHVNLTALNKYDTNYELIYHVCKNENCDEYIDAPSDLDILVSSKTINNINGEIKSRESISITIAGINTNENEDYYIKLDLNAGYIHNELALVRQITHTYYEDDVTIIAIVDGEETSKFPTTGNYGVLYECMVGTTPDNNVVVTGTWDTSDVNNYHWRLTVDNVTKPRTVCNVTFAAKSLSRIAITKNPNQMYYAPGEAFNSEGMILTGYFDQDGKEASVELSGYTVSPSVINIGNTKITITYKDGEVPFTTQLNVNIKPKLTVDLNGGTGTDVSGYYAPGSKITLTKPTKSNYSFGGWSLSDTSLSITNNVLTMGTSDVTVSALWIGVSEYNTIGNVQTFVVPANGTYKLEVWGAQGGNSNFNSGGKGGYAIGYKTFTAGENLYIYVGQAGGNSSGYNVAGAGGYNGGGAGRASSLKSVGGGGGATDIRYGGTAYSNRIIVAGGGGGAFSHRSGGNRLNGGDGGGTSGTGPNAGTQSSGNAIGIGGSAGDQCGGGGGGYYGGGAAQELAGGGGSGYIGGVSNGSMQTGVRSGDGYAKITLCDGVIC